VKQWLLQLTHSKSLGSNLLVLFDSFQPTKTNLVLVCAMTRQVDINQTSVLADIQLADLKKDQIN